MSEFGLDRQVTVQVVKFDRVIALVVGLKIILGLFFLFFSFPLATLGKCYGVVTMI